MNESMPEPIAELEKFTQLLVSQCEIPMEAWVNGLEHFHHYVVKEIFPMITLVPLFKQNWIMERAKFSGQIALGTEQGCYFVKDTRYNSHSEPVGGVFWGLTRRGTWIAGDLTYDGNFECPDTHIQLLPSTLEVIVTSYGVTPASIMGNMSRFIEDGLDDQQARLHKLRELALPVDLCVQIANLKSLDSVE